MLLHHLPHIDDEDTDCENTYSVPARLSKISHFDGVGPKNIHKYTDQHADTSEKVSECIRRPLFSDTFPKCHHTDDDEQDNDRM